MKCNRSNKICTIENIGKHGVGEGGVGGGGGGGGVMGRETS